MFIRRTDLTWYKIQCLKPSQSGRVVYNAVLAARTAVGSSPKHIYKDVDWKGSAAMLTSVQSAGVTAEVNLKITQARKDAKGIHPGFKTKGRHHPKSKTRVLVAPRKGPMSAKFFF